MNFRELNINEKIIKALDKMGYEEMTKIQEKIIPIAIEKKDIIGKSQTGTGKTIAFSIPIIENLDFENDKIEAIILTPTRELAIQISDEINRLLYFYKEKSLPIYGGEDINKQIKKLKQKPKIIVATPGRLKDHLKRHLIKPKHVSTVVLDEADEMLSMGFIEDIDQILAQIKNIKNTMLFSATLPKKIKTLSEKYMNSPFLAQVKNKTLTVELIQENYIKVKGDEKYNILTKVLKHYDPNKAIVFCKTKKGVDSLAKFLKNQGFNSNGIHGDLNQHERKNVLKKFKNGSLNILIATDIVARGIDVPDVDLVINYDIPSEVETYVHRIGRTARAGKKGLSFILVTKNEMYFLNKIKNVTKSDIEEFKIQNFAKKISSNNHQKQWKKNNKKITTHNKKKVLN